MNISKKETAEERYYCCQQHLSPPVSGSLASASQELQPIHCSTSYSVQQQALYCLLRPCSSQMLFAAVFTPANLYLG